MTMAAKTEFRHDEIAHLAYLNWQRDGCSPGRAMDYWLEAESQLKATWHLLLAACAAAEAAEAIEEIRLRELAVAFAEGCSDKTESHGQFRGGARDRKDLACRKAGNPGGKTWGGREVWDIGEAGA